MRGNLHKHSGNIVFVLSSFILFLLLFEDKLVIPSWLQPVGRMHPLILHFPIVLLLLAMLMEFFGSARSSGGDDMYARFASRLLLAGVITAGITVIMGIFLSKEEAYTAAALFRHKWSGVLLFYISSGIFALRNSAWYGAPVAKGGAIVTTIFLIMAGHFGATLTHGDNFVWQPVMEEEEPVIPLEQAIVFDHVVKPVLEKKCVSCHNPQKLKGKLRLTDSISVLRGGKSGALFVSGRPEKSLLLQRIHLSPDEKKHMPPAGKPQLTHQEKLLLHHWIKSGARFNEKVVALPESDTLRSLAASILESDKEEVEVYTFPAVTQRTLEQLNSNYRVITPVALNSPALAVNIYNKNVYTPQTLDELKEVKVQVISLHLSKIPVADADLKYVARFENLEKLNLNFTEVSGDGIKVLSALKKLKFLSLSGTKVTYQALMQHLPLFEALESVVIWETGINASELNALQTRFPHLTFEGGFMDDGADPIKLNPPRLKNKTLVFSDSISIELFHPVKGVDIRFTTDGSEPDSIASAAFRGGASVKATTAVKARAYKHGWLSSDVSVLNVYRRMHQPDTAILLSRLNRVHTANGAQTFFDYELGSYNANSPAWANNWAGVLKNDLELLVKYDRPAKVRSVSLNTLNETENNIFPPASIEIWGGASEADLKLITRLSPDMPVSYSKPFIRLVDCNFAEQQISYLKIIARPVMKLPKWHKRKDKPALLLVDEILIN